MRSRNPTPALVLAALVTAAPGCVPKEALPADDDDTTEECLEAESHIELFFYEGQAWCGEAMPGNTTCFDCHFCAVTPEAAVSNTHYVCNYCHAGPAGEILDGHGDACGCAGLTCEGDIPDPFPCQECHTDGCNGFISAEWQRYNCLYCHTGTGEPPQGPPPR